MPNRILLNVSRIFCEPSSVAGQDDHLWHGPIVGPAAEVQFLRRAVGWSNRSPPNSSVAQWKVFMLNRGVSAGHGYCSAPRQIKLIPLRDTRSPNPIVLSARFRMSAHSTWVGFADDRPKRFSAKRCAVVTARPSIPCEPGWRRGNDGYHARK